jgi:hypothetical protein
MNSTGWPATLIICALLCEPVRAAQIPKVVTVSGPTVIAFFPPVTEKDLSQAPDTNESLSDFQFYVQRVRGELHDAGIDFQEIYASSFSLRFGAKTKRFHPRKTQVGYYFVAPGKSPHVEYGVMTDADILQAAKKYFSTLQQTKLNPLQKQSSATQQNTSYSLVDPYGYIAAHNESNPQKRIQLLESYLAQNPNSSLLPFLYYDLLRTYYELQDYPNTVKYADKLLALGDEIDSTSQNEIRTIRSDALGKVN